MEEPQEVIDVMKFQLTYNHFLRPLKTCQHQVYRLQPHDLLITQQNEQEQNKWQESIDPLKLVLGKVIGRGSFAVVYKGSYNGQTVAVKVLDFDKKEVTKASMESMKNDFMKEVGVWEKLDHPNVTKMIGATLSMKTYSGHKNKTSKTESNYCIVSEYVNGGSLKSYLLKNRNKKLPLKVVLQFALDIAKGLTYLHSMKIIHRDVKPANILIDSRHNLKLADFGESIFDPLELFTSGKIGTRGYMAPEVVTNKPYGHKCDVYSFGICLWEIYCCKKACPCNLDNISADIYELMRPSIPVNCPPLLAQLIERCWDTDPSKRPEMKDVVVELEEIVKSEEWKTLSKDQNGVNGCFGFFNQAR